MAQQNLDKVSEINSKRLCLKITFFGQDLFYNCQIKLLSQIHLYTTFHTHVL